MHRSLPSGTVTFLFTDVEGSTKLLHELGPEEYAQALAEHRRLLRAVFARHGGVEVDTQGDAFFVAFPTAPGAVIAAAEAVEELTVGPIRVRIGIHTGTPLVADEGYVGHEQEFSDDEVTPPRFPSQQRTWPQSRRASPAMRSCALSSREARGNEPARWRPPRGPAPPARRLLSCHRRRRAARRCSSLLDMTNASEQQRAQTILARPFP